MISFVLPDSTSPVTPAFENTIMNDSGMNPSGVTGVEMYLPICDRNIFDSQHRSPCALENEAGGGEAVVLDLNSAPIKSDLGATLLGTMVSTNPRRSFATITPKSQPDTKNYHICEEGDPNCLLILGEGRVYEIQRNKVFFIRNGHREYLEVENLPSIYMAPPPATSPTGGGEGVKLVGDKAIVSRAKVDATLGNLNDIIQQARMVPNFEGGTVDGFKVFAIRPGSIFQELGLQNGDVIHRINGTDIDTVEKAIPMLQLARTESSISIDLTRRGQKKTLMIEVQ